MAKSRKLLSVMLVLTIMFSTISAALVAFAAEPDNIVESINAYVEKYGEKAPDEAVSELEKICADYKALSDAQKDSLDIIATGSLFAATYDRVNNVNKAAGIKGDELKAKNGEDQDKLLGYTDAMKKAQEFANRINTETVKSIDGSKEVKINALTSASKWNDANYDKEALRAAFDKLVEDYKALDAATVRYLPNIYTVYGCYVFSRNSVYSPYEWSNKIYNVEKGYQESLNPFTEKSPSYVSKPNPDKFPGGETDPDYIAALEKYNQYLADKAAYDERKAAAESVWHDTARKFIKDVDAIANAVINDTEALFAVLTAYEADPSQINLDALSEAFAKTQEYNAVYAKYLSNNTSVKYLYGKELVGSKDIVAAAKAILGRPLLDAFIEAVNSVTEPYTREDVQKVIDAYNAVFSESYSQIPAEVMDKFEDMVANMPASEEKPILPEWTRPDLKYPAQVGEKRTELLIETLDTMILSLIKGQGYESIKDILSKELYTNYTVAMIPQALYPMLEQVLNDAGAGIAIGFLELSPQALAKVMDEEKFAKARDLFNGLAPEGEEDSTAHWSNLDLTKIENGTFGFQDGDREGFVNALAAVLRGLTVPLTSGLIAVDFVNEVKVPNVNYGIYENLLPVLEALDIEGLMTSKEYTDNFNATEGNAKADAAILPIINPVFDFVEKKLSAAPLATLVDILPKLAHVLNDNILNNQLQLIIENNLGMIGSFAGDMLAGLKIEPSAIIGLVNSLIGNLQIGDVTLSLKLSDPDWVLLATTAKPVIKDSITAENAYRVGFETNKSDTFLVTFRYLFENITEENNLASIKKAISALVTDPSITQVIDQVLGSIAGLSADEALVMICDLLGVPQVEEPTDPTTPTEPGTDNGNNPTPPANGDSMMIGAFAAVAMLAGAALVITKKKK